MNRHGKSTCQPASQSLSPIKICTVSPAIPCFNSARAIIDGCFLHWSSSGVTWTAAARSHLPLFCLADGCGWPIAMSEELLHLELFSLTVVWQKRCRGKREAYRLQCHLGGIICTQQSVYQQQRVSAENNSGDTPPHSSLSSTGPWSLRGRKPLRNGRRH